MLRLPNTPARALNKVQISRLPEGISDTNDTQKLTQVAVIIGFSPIDVLQYVAQNSPELQYKRTPALLWPPRSIKRFTVNYDLNGGDDGARTRDLCRDRSAFDRNSLKRWAPIANKALKRTGKHG